MSLLVKTTIRHSADLEPCDGFGLEPDEIDLLQAYEEYNALVTVDCKSTNGYFNIELADGTTIEALSWYHLDGFDEDGPML